MKTQVLSVEQMKRLQELGVDTSKASMMYHFWVDKKHKNCFLLSADTATPYDSENVPTFTLQDMLEMMPPHFYSFPFEDKERYVIHDMVMERLTGEWLIGYRHGLIKGELLVSFQGDLLTCVYESLCWLAENGYLKGGNNESK